MGKIIILNACPSKSTFRQVYILFRTYEYIRTHAGVPLRMWFELPSTMSIQLLQAYNNRHSSTHLVPGVEHGIERAVQELHEPGQRQRLAVAKACQDLAAFLQVQLCMCVVHMWAYVCNKPSAICNHSPTTHMKHMDHSLAFPETYSPPSIFRRRGPSIEAPSGVAV